MGRVGEGLVEGEVEQGLELLREEYGMKGVMGE